MSQSPFSHNPQGGKQSSVKTSLFKKEFTLKLSFSGIAGLCIVALLGFGWIFAFGVIVGRGFEGRVPTLSKILAGPEHTASPPAAHEIIKAEDLTFHADLKDTPNNKTQQAAPVQALAKSGSSAMPIENKQNPATTPPASTVSAGTPAPDAPQSAKPERKDFVLQLIAYKTSEQADGFREKLEGEGIRTRLVVEKNSKGKVKWYKVVALMRGTETDLGALKEKLGKAGIKSPLVVSSKPVSKR